VARLRGHTTSNSPFCHWLTVPGTPTFSLPLKRMSPRIVLCVPPATKSRMALRSRPTLATAAVRISSPAAKAYFDAHVKKFGAAKEPDRWASGATWAGLEILTAAVAKAGLDRKAIRDYVAGTEHNTILGKIKFAGSENVGTPGTVSQWQKGEFEVVWPKASATAPLVPAKPAWV